jgi:hypothetical protein
MKITILAMLLASVCCVVIPIYGQTTRKDTEAGKAKPADSQPPKAGAVNVDTVNVAKLNIHEQTEPTGKSDDKSTEPKSYFSRLVTPENFNQWVLCFVGIAGIIVAVCTVKTIQRQTKVFHGQLIAMQRPRIEVKWVYLALKNEDDAEYPVGITLANVGGSRAQITESNLTVKKLGIGPMESLLRKQPAYDGRYFFGQFCMAPGERTDKTVVLDSNTDASEFRWFKAMEKNDFNMKRTHLICYGFLRYLDDSGVARLTGFGWRWNPEDMSFTRIESPDYEYTD